MLELEDGRVVPACDLCSTPLVKRCPFCVSKASRWRGPADDRRKVYCANLLGECPDCGDTGTPECRECAHYLSHRELKE